MGKKTAFIGHRDIYCNDIEKRLTIAIENEIDLGCKYFTMGTHGEFDKLSLSKREVFLVLYKEDYLEHLNQKIKLKMNISKIELRPVINK